MNAPQYKPGGAEWHKVEAIIKACSCSRLRAVSALKSCNNDQDKAIDSLDEALFISKPNPGRSADEIPISSNGTTAISTLTENFKKLVGVKKDPPPETKKKDDTFELHEECAPAIPQGEKDTGKEIAGSEDIVKREEGLPPKFRIKDDPPPQPPLPPVSNTSRSRSHLSAPPKPQKPKIPHRDHDDPEPLTTHGLQAPTLVKTPLSEQWDLHLPLIKLSDDEPDFTPEEGLTQPLSIRRLLTSLQTGMKRGMLQHYLSFFSETLIATQINTPIHGFPAIFYAVATNDEKVVRTWVDNGGDVNAVDETYHIPLLAFTILMADAMIPHTTSVLTTLLSLGADVSVIPRCFFTPFLDDPPAKSPFTNTRYREFEEEGKKWCVDYLRPIMARSVNLTQRYFLHRTLSEKRPSERQIQVAITHHALSLLGIGYFMVGQSSAAKMVIQKSLSQMALPKSKPLVMVFSGPSGHGKTELAKRMGELLGLEIECIDCTELRYETDLFGPKKPYIGHELGSPLNNFLTRLSGRRCIVFLDEFEKTTTDVQNSLLIPFDEGKYTDRRNRQAVDCSKTIWIMATNALDDTILDFCDVHQEQVYQTDDSHRHAEIMAELSAKLKKQLKSTFGNPLSGRVSTVIPFLPFSAPEAAVVAHKYVLSLTQKVSQHIQISGQQLVGRIILTIKQDGAICKLIAGEGYDASQGARSLKAAVETRIEDELVQRYLEEDGRIEDWQPLSRYTVDLSRNGVLNVWRTAD